MTNFKIDNRIILFLFSTVFGLVELSDLLVPYRAEGFSEISLLVYYSAFGFIFFSLFISCFFRFSLSVRFPSVGSFVRTTNVLVILSVTALVMVVYDRVLIQGVDYSLGLAQAREMWRVLSNERVGASSIFNVVGNLIFPFVYFSIAFCTLFFERSYRLRRNFYISVVLVFVFSAVTGGRELLLVLFGIFLSSLAFRFSINVPVIARGMKKDFVLIFATASFFAVYVGYLRSQSYDFGMDEYGRSLATRLGASGELVDGVSSYTPDVLLPVLIYLAHVKWVFLNMAENVGPEGLSTFRQIFKMLSEYLSVSLDWVDYRSPAYSPNWISLVGSLYYDLGWGGVFGLCCFFVMSPLLYLLLFSVAEFNRSGLSVSFYLFANAIIIFSPFAFLFEVVQFIYLMVFLMVSFFLALLPYKKLLNKKLEVL